MTFLGRFDLSDEEYALLEPLLPPERPAHKAGHPWASHRKILDGIFWRLRTGAPWRDIPERYGPWSTIYSRFRRWRIQGRWQKILNKLQEQAHALGRIDFDFSAFDGANVRAHKAAAGAQKKETGRVLSHEESQQKQALGMSRGGLGSKIHVLCEGAGKPITLSVTPGQQNETTQVEVLLDQVRIQGLLGRRQGI